ncbi:MAG: metallophosphoesterase [Clostridia bacterium]|nr:metallophosphoesterase [Clostridia bacterium]
MRIRKIPVFILLLLLVLFIIAGLFNQLKVASYQLCDEKVDETIKIIQLSDLHNQIYDSDQKKLIDMIKSCNPDVIVLTGDIGDDVEPMTGTRLLLEGIKETAPIYYVTGNHEHWADDTDDIIREIVSYGVILLDNRTEMITVNGNEMTISGVSDPESGSYDDSFLENLKTDDFNILLAHRPERIQEYAGFNIDLIFSGHAHGGQFRIPFLINGFFSPNQGFFPRYAGGKYEIKDSIMIVSRGLSHNKWIPRFYNNPEVVLTEIKGVKND